MKKNYHYEIIDLKMKDLEKREEINNLMKNKVAEMCVELDGPLSELADKLGISEVDNFKKAIVRKAIDLLELDAKTKVIRSKDKNGKFTEKELSEKILEVEKKKQQVAGMVL